MVGRPRVDISGVVFGRLTAITDLRDQLDGRTIWSCECECGNIAFVAYGDLTRKTPKGTRSCGCLRAERARINGNMNKSKKKKRVKRW